MTNYPIQQTIAEEAYLVREVSLPIYESKGWLKFLGILSIIGGAIQALSLFGIVVAWLPIWMGVVLYQAASNIEAAHSSGQRSAVIAALNNLKTYFIINGILLLIGIVLVVLFICLGIVLPLVFGLSILPFLDPSYYY